jgi:hypothetical protein
MTSDTADTTASDAERAPLIALADEDEYGHDIEVADESNGHGATPEANATLLRLRRSARWYQAQTPRGVVLLMTWLVGVLTLCGSISLIPLGRLIESVLCQRFYDTTDPVPEDQCKGDEVQTELAWIGAWIGALGSVVSLVVAFPWSILSDRYAQLQSPLSR